MHTIKVFLSFVSPEMQETQDVLSDYLENSVRSTFKYDGVDIEVIKHGEPCLNDIGEQLQSEIDKSQRGCDVSVFLLKSEVGRDAVHEFDMARKIQEKQYHLILVFFFEVTKAETSKELVDFQNRLIEEGHYWFTSEDVNDSKSQLILELLRLKSHLFKTNSTKEIEKRGDIDKDIDELRNRIKIVLDDEKKNNTNRKDRVVRLFREVWHLAEDSNYNKEKQYDMLSEYFRFLREYDLYDEAQAVCRRQISIAEKLFGLKHEKTAKSYNNLGTTCWQLGDYEKAFEYDSKALKIRKEVLGEEHPVTAESYNNIGSVYHKQGNYDMALRYHFKALAIRKNILGIDHPDTATSYSNIGEVYDEHGDYKKALEAHNKALAIRKKVSDCNPAKTADSYNNIGLVYLGQGKYNVALNYYRKALRIYEKDPDTNQPDIAESYNNIGKVFYIKGDFDNALENDSKALVIRKKVLGEEHPDTAESYNNIGKVHYAKDNYDEALECYRKSLTIKEKILGVKHKKTAESYNNIGSVYWQQENYEGAFEYDTKALKIREEVLGEKHPDTAESYNNIGSVYYRQDNYAMALKFYFKALAIREEFLGIDHPDTATSYSNIGEVYCKQGDYNNALEFHQKALAIREKILGEGHAKSADSYNNIGLVLYNKGDLYWAREYYKMALKKYEKALSIREKVLGKEHLDTAESYNNIGLAYNAMNDYRKASDYFNRALQVREEKLGKGNAVTKSTHEGLNIVDIAMQLRDVLQRPDNADGLEESIKLLLSNCSCSESSLWLVNHNGTHNKPKDDSVFSISLASRDKEPSVNYSFEKEEDFVRKITAARLKLLSKTEVGEKCFLRFNNKTPELSDFVSEEFVVKENLRDFIIIPVFGKEDGTKTIAFIELSYKKSIYDDDYWKRLSSKIQREFSDALHQYKIIKKQRLIEDFIKIHSTLKDSDPDALFKTILDDVFLKYCPVQGASFFIWDTYNNRYKLVATTGLKGEPNPEKVFFFRGEGRTGQVGQTGEPLIINNLTQEEPEKYSEKLEVDALTEMFIPIIDPADDNSVIGVIRLVNKNNFCNSKCIDYFNDSDAALMNYAAEYMSLIISNYQKEEIQYDFVDKLTHEFTTPANAILSTADRLYTNIRDEEFLSKYLSSYLKNIIDLAERQKWQAKTNLFLSRNLKKQPFEARYSIKPTLLWDVINKGIDVAIPTARKYDVLSQNISINRDSDRNLTINIDEDAFIAVFYNLFTNAIKYHDPKNKDGFYLRTSYWIGDNNLIITIEDKGMGIKEKDKSKIFEKGYRSESAIRSNSSGYGVGLTFVKQIVKDFGGDISITSLMNPTVFRIDIPLIKIQ